MFSEFSKHHSLLTSEKKLVKTLEKLNNAPVFEEFRAHFNRFDRRRRNETASTAEGVTLEDGVTLDRVKKST